MVEATRRAGLGIARARWGGAAVLAGGRDATFLHLHRSEILVRLVARGLTVAEAAQAFAAGLAAATGHDARETGRTALGKGT